MSPRSDWIDKQTILDNLQEAILVVSSDLEIIYANQRMETATGYAAEEICAMELDELEALTDRDSQSLRATVEAVVGGSATERRTDIELSSADVAVNDEVVAEAHVSQLSSEDHDTAALVVFRDITERKERERALHQFSNAVEFAGHAIFITDTETAILINGGGVADAHTVAHVLTAH